MNKTDKIILGLIFLGSIVAIFYPDTKPFRRIVQRHELLYEINKQGRYLTVDEAAQHIMEADPSYIFVDIRPPKEYAKYTINNAINVPFDSITSPSLTGLLDADVYTVVLFSNGSRKADEAWLILRSYDYHNIKVLKGGLNSWYRNILDPLPPDPKFSGKQAWKRYMFRKGAQVFFTGISPVGNKPASKPKKVAIPAVKHKKKEITGGCG